jgi:adenine deaminase
MNYPGVLNADAEVMRKISHAKKYNKPVDGHAPGLRGDVAKKYIEAGLTAGQAVITTDHECFTKEEALDKLKYGMKIIIREGSAAKNFDALHELISEFPEMVMLCSDDKHPDDLLLGHINQLAARAVSKGHDVMNVLQCACVNPIKHYNLPVGLLQENDPADFIVVDDLKNFNVLQTYINGELVAENKKSILPQKIHPVINNFSVAKKSENDFKIIATPAYRTGRDSQIRVIEALDGQLITKMHNAQCTMHNGYAISNVENDILKIVVVNRYSNEKPAVAFIKNFGLKSGAIASTVAHDSHNIIAIGTTDAEICKAVNLLIENKGGLSCVNGNENSVIALPIAGLMSDKSCEEIGNAYSLIDKKVKAMGCKLRSHYMTLSFMALLVIPNLKLSDKGLFDGKEFKFTDLFMR